MNTFALPRGAAPILLVLSAACVDEPFAVPGPEAAASLESSPAYSLVDLGTLGGPESYARAINGSMQVVGTSQLASGVEHAFLWTPAGGMVDLGTLGGLPDENSRAWDINDSGEVAGESGGHPVLRTSGGTWLDLLPADRSGGRTLAINNQGDAVGQLQGSARGSTAFLYRPGQGVVELFDKAFIARDVNDSLQIVGVYHGVSGRDSVFVMRYPGPIRAITGGPTSSAEAINNQGVVVGTRGLTENARAFVWDSVSGLRILPRPPGSGGGSRAYDIDEAGRIVGSVQNSGTSPMYAALWTPDGAGGYVLNVLASKQAEGMDESGNLVGFAGFPANHAALWTTADQPPAAPGALAAEIIAEDSLRLSWSDGSNNETRFEVWRSRRQGDGSYPADELLGQVPVNTVSFLDSTVAVGETYRYRVQACSATFCTTSSPLIVAVPLPATAPANLSASVGSAGRMDLAWTGGSNAGEFRVRRSIRAPDGTFPPDQMLGLAPGGAVAYPDSAVGPGGVYRYRVLACNALGCASSDAVVAGVPMLPAAPGGVTAEVASSRRIDLAWTDASSNEGRFQVRRSTRAGDGTYPPYEALASLRAGATGFGDTTVVPGGVYRYQVQACNVTGCASGVTVGATVPIPPEPPTGVTARRVPGGVELRWTDASSTETSFRVRRSLRRADGTFGGYAPLDTLPAGSIQYLDGTVAGGATYRYRVEACRGASCVGAISGPVTMP